MPKNKKFFRKTRLNGAAMIMYYRDKTMYCGKRSVSFVHFVIFKTSYKKRL